MTVQMPEPIPLDPPPGDADAIADLVRDMRSAQRCLAAVDIRISGPTTDTAGWLGDDATAAAAQLTALSGLVRAADDAVTPAAERLAAHAEHLLETRSRIRALEREQDEQFLEAWRRLHALPDLQAQLMTGGPGVRAIVADVEAGEAGRRRRHHALLEEIGHDAAATARVLTDAGAVIGSRSRTGEANQVVAYLAARLPGWGDRELVRRALALAEDFTDLELRPEGREEMARLALPFADAPAFARALVLTWGVEGTRAILQRLGDGLFGPTSALAALTALVLGAAARSSGASDPVGAVLAAEYLPPADPDVRHDLTALGMGTVLAASALLGARGLAKPTLLEWGEQVAVRENLQKSRAIDRIHPTDSEAPPVDPLPVVVAILADAQDPTSAAAFLAYPAVWTALLTRTWPDQGASLARLTPLAAHAPGVLGDAAVRGALDALAGGLEDGDIHALRVVRATADAVLPALADALALHISVVGEALDPGVDRTPRFVDESMLRGLGYLTTNREAADVVETALLRWVAAQPAPFSAAAGAEQRFPAIVVPNAYLAVQEYGQELAHAWGELELEKRANDRAFLWNMAALLATGLLGGPWGVAAGVVADYVAMGLHLDGTWTPGPDQELVFAPQPFDPAALRGLSEDDWLHVFAIAHIAEDSFVGTKQALGTVAAPSPPTTHWWEPLPGILDPSPRDVIEHTYPRGARVPPIR